MPGERSGMTGRRRAGRVHSAWAAALIAVCTLLLLLQPASAAPNRVEFYRVQTGDTWNRIAVLFAIPIRDIWRANGVTNPALLAEGQRLYIPSTGGAQGSALMTFEIGADVSTLRAAVASGNNVATLLALNGLASAATALGQVVYAPDRRDAVAVAAAGQPRPTIAPTADAPSDAEGEQRPPPPAEGTLVSERMGVQGHFLIADDEQRQRLLDMAAYEASFGWVKQQVRWDEFEWAPGQYSEPMLEALDKFVHDAYQRQMRILLSIAHAPEWARGTDVEDGPPADYNNYYNFVGFIVARYKYMLSAIEVWNEPNLGREWRGGTIGGGEYVQLLAGSYDRIKREYPEGNLIVVSAGLAPTGVNDGITAVDDRVFLRQMYEAGVESYADAIGIHPYSWGNPPSARCCGDWGGAPSHNDHPSFFFLNTIEDYRAIQLEFGGTRPFWATEFGWGTMDGLDLPTPPDAPFFNYVNQEQQGRYIIEAYRMAQSWDFMGPMFLWNLNIAQLPGLDTSQSGYSVLRATESGNPLPRRAFQMVQEMPKS